MHEETTELYLIRHGESVPNVTPIIGGMRGDAGLTDRGREQAQLLEKRLRKERLHADQLYASTLPRALETAEYVARALDLPVQPDDELHELRPGEADGLTVDQWRERYWPRPPAVRDAFTPLAPGGESWVAFLARAGAAIAALVDRHPGQTVVAVCPAVLSRPRSTSPSGSAAPPTASPSPCSTPASPGGDTAAPRRPPGMDRRHPQRRRSSGRHGHNDRVAPRGRPKPIRRRKPSRGRVSAWRKSDPSLGVWFPNGPRDRIRQLTEAVRQSETGEHLQTRRIVNDPLAVSVALNAAGPRSDAPPHAAGWRSSTMTLPMSTRRTG